MCLDRVARFELELRGTYSIYTRHPNALIPFHEDMKRPKFEPFRAQVAALPVRIGPDGCEVLLITSRESRRWLIPKGWPMNGRKDHEAAAQEAFEEAGIKGKIHKHPIGAYTYSKRLPNSIEKCRVMVYRLDVQKERTNWLEREQRTRQWFPAREAAKRVSEPALASMILGLGERSEVA